MKNGSCPIVLAVLSITSLLLSASPLSLEAQSIFDAARRGDADAVRQLLATGAGLATRTVDDDRTPLHFAAAHGHVDVCSLLVAAGWT